MWYLYKITNTVNNKLYVGITTNPSKRWETHLVASKDSQKPLYQAIRKHGVPSFVMEIICADIMSEQAALLLEAEHIKKLNSLVINGHGYNINNSRSGNSSTSTRLVVSLPKDHERVELGDGPTGVDFYSRCYYAIDWEGEPHNSEEGEVKWLTAEEVCSTKAAFGDYNRKTLNVFKQMFPNVYLKGESQ
jgi:predicted GIY-YIG superfamily endonuclease